MHKIVVISMVKNEADVIESFVRHSLTFADEILIADHASSDKTGEILRALQEEGLPIHIKRLFQVELAHAEVMNGLMWEAMEQYGADILLPMDADEFLVNTENGTSCRDILQGLDAMQVYKLEWRVYEPLHPHQDEDKFLLSRPCRRGKEVASGQKIIVGCGLAQTKPFKLIQGCHYAYWDTEQGRLNVPWETAPFLHTAHFHWRSDEQYAAKVAVSWINNVAKYSIHTPTAGYLGPCFESIRKGERVVPANLLSDAEEYDLKPHVLMQELRYSADVRPDVLKNLMSASVLMAEAYLEKKLLDRHRKITMVVPYTDDASLRDAFAQLKKQIYPYYEIFVLMLEEHGTAMQAERLLSLWDGAKEISLKVLYTDTDGSIYRKLSEQATGDYVAWLFPKTVLTEDYLVKMLAAAEMQDFPFCIVLTSDRRNLSEWMPYFSYPVKEEMGIPKANLLYAHCLEGGQYPAGMEGALIKRSSMERARWYQDCFLGSQPLFFSMWRRLIRDMPDDEHIAVIAADYVSRPWEQVEIDTWLWHQIEWYGFLQEDGAELLSKEALDETWKRFKGNANIAKHATDATPELLKEYLAIVQQV